MIVGGEIEENQFYGMTLRMVLQDEKAEDVMRRLSVCGVSSGDAELIYAVARKERIVTIRCDCWERLRNGLYWVGGAAGVFCIFFWGLHLVPWFLIGLCGSNLLFGFWKIADGLSGVIMASSKDGPV